MASATEAEAEERDKPIVVRVKRKPSQTRPDAFWLEINERPVKKAMLDFSSLSVSEPSSAPNKASEEPRIKKLLVQHIETVHHSEAVQDVLHSLLHSDLDAKEIKSKTKEWNNRTNQDKKQDQLRSAARQRHEDLGRNARFAQIWRSRKGDRNEVDESLREICHLYDAVQVDSDEEKHPAEPRITSFEEGAILCNFLPLIREHLPSAAEEIESDIISLAQSEDSDVYDIYTVKEVDDDTTMEGTSSAPYPLLQVDNGDDVCYDDDDPYDTDDSNAEDNPLYDYPAELSEDEDDDSNSENPFSDLDGSDPEYEKEEDKEPTMEDLPSNLGQPSTSASSVDASYSANRIEDSQLFLSVPALNQAASYLAQTASYLTQCLPVSGYTAISDEGQELATLPPASTAGGSSFQASSEQSADSSPGEIDNTGSSSQEITEQMAPLRVFQNGASLFQGLVERARKTVRGSADDIGWLQQDQSLPPTEDGTARFLEILDAVRKNEHKLPDSMVYLLVPGLFSNHGPLYFVKTKSYFSKMGLACHIAKIHSESSVSKNAREIKEYIEEIYWGSKKRVLLLGHSKGGVDAAAALSLYWPQLKDKVAGLALAQSPYGGSPVASDILREGQLGDYVRLRKLMEILVSKVLKGDLQALEDLTYERRKEFLRQNPLPPEVPIVSFHTEASITPSVLTALSHVAHLELPAAADGNPTRIPVVMPLSAAMAACSQLLVARYGEKSDGLVTRKDAEVPGSVVVRPERKLDHAWMVYSSLKEEPRDQADTSQVCEALLTLLVEVAQKRRHEMAMKDE
ncbi:hypothetical protein OsJ_32677 [Oryza sativa Japonica Group]|uniref:Uncharacterized protein n=3 Tax=Oryza sativa subsp. japonica TaxID=39947 RepID=B9G905_ORYSJ|nr:hypothetical protein OsJ_32677 [Oryza sativa Japonica Group]